MLTHKAAGITGTLSMPREWKVFGVFPDSEIIPAAGVLAAVPDALELEGLRRTAQNVRPRAGVLDMEAVFGRRLKVRETVYVFIPLEAGGSRPVTLGFGADWWMQAWLNGEEVLDTTGSGNGEAPISVGNHTVTVSLRRGRNLIAIRFFSGMSSSLLAAGGPAELREVAPGQLNLSGEPRAERFVLPDRETFLRRLELSRPDLGPVRAALGRGDVEGAGRAYAAHFRRRRFDLPAAAPDWSAKKPDPRADTARADRILAGHLSDGYAACEAPGGIEWGRSPLGCATRFPMLEPVAGAAFNTGDSRYVRWAVEHVLGYMEAYPIAGFAGRRMADGWVSHFVMAGPWYWCMWFRLVEMARALDLLRRYPQVTDEELLRILQRMHEEVAFMQNDIQRWVDNRHNGGLGLIGDMDAALRILDDFAQTPAWREYNGRLAAQYAGEAFYPDGMCIELTVAYSAACSVQTQCLAYDLRRTEAVRALRPKLREMLTCLVALAGPDQRLPSFGDLYAGTVDLYVHPPLARWLGLPWAGTASRESGDGPRPPFTEWPPAGREQWCGYYTMRSGWEPSARYMAIDGGPWGTTHQHGDKLSFAAAALGAWFIVDPCSTRYASNEPDAFIGTQPSGFLHNTVTVDGVDEFMYAHGLRPELESKAPRGNRWETADGYTLFVGGFSFAPVKPVRWERRMLFAGKDYWLMQDVLTGGRERVQVEQNFQFDAEIEIEFSGGLVIATAPNGARLALAPLSGGLEPRVTVGDRTPHATCWPDGSNPTTVLKTEDGHDQVHGRGWVGRGGHKLIPAPAVTFIGEVRLPAVVTVAIIPLEPGRTPADLPKIASRVSGGQTRWLLPISGGQLEVLTDAGNISARRVR